MHELALAAKELALQDAPTSVLASRAGSTVRGAISGAIRKKLGLSVSAMTIDGRGKAYRIELVIGGSQADEAL